MKVILLLSFALIILCDGAPSKLPSKLEEELEDIKQAINNLQNHDQEFTTLMEKMISNSENLQQEFAAVNENLEWMNDCMKLGIDCAQLQPIFLLHEEMNNKIKEIYDKINECSQSKSLQDNVNDDGSNELSNQFLLRGILSTVNAIEHKVNKLAMNGNQTVWNTILSRLYNISNPAIKSNHKLDDENKNNKVDVKKSSDGDTAINYDHKANDTKNTNDTDDYVELLLNCTNCNNSNNSRSHNDSIKLCEDDRHVEGLLCHGLWTVIQKNNEKAGEEFNKSWKDYKNGFGDKSNNYLWIGNDFLHNVTTKYNVTLRIVLEDFDGNIAVGDYHSFHVDDEKNHYQLHIDKFSGNLTDSMKFHDNAYFSTFDENHDGVDSCCPCSISYKSGWWFTDCFYVNLNGPWRLLPYGNNYIGIIYDQFPMDGDNYSLKSSIMMIRKDFSFIEDP